MGTIVVDTSHCTTTDTTTIYLTGTVVDATTRVVDCSCCCTSITRLGHHLVTVNHCQTCNTTWIQSSTTFSNLFKRLPALFSYDGLVIKPLEDQVTSQLTELL